MKTKFKPWHYVQVYLFAREGKKVTAIARAIGVTPMTLRSWIEKDKGMKEVYQKAKKEHEVSLNRKSGLEDYFYKRLPPHLQMLWDELIAFDEANSGPESYELLYKGKSPRIQQHLFVHALVTSSFNVSEACRMTGISHARYKRWCILDPHFADLLEEVKEHKKNFFDSSLVRLVEAGDSPATIFANKTYNKDRYGEELNVKVEGSVQHQHHVLLDIETAPLSLRTRRELLQILRKQQAGNLEDNSSVVDGVIKKKVISSQQEKDDDE